MQESPRPVMSEQPVAYTVRPALAVCKSSLDAEACAAGEFMGVQVGYNRWCHRHHCEACDSLGNLFLAVLVAIMGCRTLPRIGLRMVLAAARWHSYTSLEHSLSAGLHGLAYGLAWPCWHSNRCLRVLGAGHVRGSQQSSLLPCHQGSEVEVWGLQMSDGRASERKGWPHAYATARVASPSLACRQSGPGRLYQMTLRQVIGADLREACPSSMQFSALVQEFLSCWAP